MMTRRVLSLSNEVSLMERMHGSAYPASIICIVMQSAYSALVLG